MFSGFFRFPAAPVFFVTRMDRAPEGLVRGWERPMRCSHPKR